MKHNRKYGAREVYQDITRGIVGGLSAANVFFSGDAYLNTEWLNGTGHLSIAAAVAFVLINDIRSDKKRAGLHIPANDIPVFWWALGAAEDIMSNDPADFTDAEHESLERLTKMAKAAGYEG